MVRSQGQLDGLDCLRGEAEIREREGGSEGAGRSGGRRCRRSGRGWAYGGGRDRRGDILGSAPLQLQRVGQSLFMRAHKVGELLRMYT